MDRRLGGPQEILQETEKPLVRTPKQRFVSSLPESVHKEISHCLLKNRKEVQVIIKDCSILVVTASYPVKVKYIFNEAQSCMKVM
jgi:hypothetical protein